MEDIEVGDWVQYRTHSRGVEIAEVKRVVDANGNPHYRLSTNYSVERPYIIEVRKKGTP